MVEGKIFEKIKVLVEEENWNQYLKALKGGTLKEEAVKVYLFNRLLEKEKLLNDVVFYHSRSEFQKNIPDYRYEEGYYKVAIEVKPFAERKSQRKRETLLEVEIPDEKLLEYIPLSFYYKQRGVWEQIRNYAETYEFVILTNMVEAYLFHRHGIEFGAQIEQPEHFGVVPFEEIFQHIKERTLYSYLKQKLLQYPLRELDRRFFDDVRHYYKALEKSIIPVIKEEKERKELAFKILISLILARTMEDFLVVPYGIVEEMYKREKALFEVKQEKFVERFLGAIYDLFWTYYDTEFFKVYSGDFLKQKELVDTIGKVLGYEKWDAVFGKGLKFYNFGLLNEDVLGGVYEMFLAWLKMDERKEKGIYYTPKAITEYFADKVEEFLLKPLKEKFFFLINEERWDEAERIVKEITKIKVLDPACGSGSFLIKVYRKFLEFYDELLRELEEKQRMVVQGASEILKGSKMGRALSEAAQRIRKIESLIVGKEVDERWKINKAEVYKKVAERHIFGVDIDSFAVKLAKLNLLVEALKHGGPNVYEYKRLRNEQAEEVFSDLEKNLKVFDSVGCNLDEFLGAFDGARFDVVLGNPPYVRHERLELNYKEKLVRIYGLNKRTLDYSCYFIMRGIEALKEGGYLMFIITNKWLRSDYGETVREFLKNYNLIEFLDFASERVFKKYEYDKERDSFRRQDVNVDVMTMIVEKREPSSFVKVGVYKKEEDEERDLDVKLKTYLKDETNRIVLEQKVLTRQKTWSLVDSKILSLKEKIEKVGKPLKKWDVKIYRGVLTGYNDAFIIDTETRNRILANCKDEEERRRTEEIIKPVLRGRDIEKYRYKWAGLWIIIIPAGWTNKHRGRENPEEFFRKTFPALYNHFMRFVSVKRKGKGLFDRDDQGDYWWELRPCDYYPEFEKEKIVFNKTTKGDYAFAYDFQKCFVNQSTYIMVSEKYDQKLLLGILNSQLFRFAYRKFYSGGGIEGEITIFTLENFPLPPITKETQPLADQIVQKVQEILTLTQSPDFEASQEKQQKVKELEKEIDRLVYQLYDLTEEEIKMIESKVEENTTEI